MIWKLFFKQFWIWVSEISLISVKFGSLYYPGKKYQENLNASDLLVRSTTISENVHEWAEQYRSDLRPILIEQVAWGCLCLCPDLWSDKCRYVNYLYLTAIFLDKNYHLISLDLYCCEYHQTDKSSDSVLEVSILIIRQERLFRSFLSNCSSIRFIWFDFMYAYKKISIDMGSWSKYTESFKGRVISPVIHFIIHDPISDFRAASNIVLCRKNQ
jgi:hypothetical protein